MYVCIYIYILIHLFILSISTIHRKWHDCGIIEEQHTPRRGRLLPIYFLGPQPRLHFKDPSTQIAAAPARSSAATLAETSGPRRSHRPGESRLVHMVQGGIFGVMLYLTHPLPDITRVTVFPKTDRLKPQSLPNNIDHRSGYVSPDVWVDRKLLDVGLSLMFQVCPRRTCEVFCPVCFRLPHSQLPQEPF